MQKQEKELVAKGYQERLYYYVEDGQLTFELERKQQGTFWTLMIKVQVKNYDCGYKATLEALCKGFGLSLV